MSDKIVKLQITFRNTEATEALKSYATEKITHCLQKFIHSDTEGKIVLRVEKNFQEAEFWGTVNGTELAAKAEKADLYSAIDALVDLLSQQLRKSKEKLVQHH